MSEITTHQGGSETRILDPALAEEMAYAGKEERVQLAAGAQVLGVCEELDAALTTTERNDSAPYIAASRKLEENKRVYRYSPIQTHDLSLQELALESGSVSTALRWKEGISERSRSALDAMAERRETWAKRLYMSPDCNLDVDTIIHIEDGIAQQRGFIEADQETAAKLRDMAVPVSIAEITRIYKKEVADHFWNEPDYDKEDWEQLSSSPDTTIKELRKFVATALEIVGARIQSLINEDQARLDAIGKPKKRA